MKIYALIILPLLVTSCSLLQKKVNSDSVNTAPGFEYKYPKTGEWILERSQSGSVIIKKKLEDAISYGKT